MILVIYRQDLVVFGGFQVCFQDFTNLLTDSSKGLLDFQVCFHASSDIMAGFGGLGVFKCVFIILVKIYWF